MTIRKLIIAAALAAPAAVTFTAPATAQTIGAANPVVAMGNSKAFDTLNEQIAGMFKANLDQVDAKEKARQALLIQLDKNGDKNVDQAELDAAAAAKNPVLDQLSKAENEINTLAEPAIRAQAYGIEKMLDAYDTAVQKVATSRKLNAILQPDSFVYAAPGADVTEAITAEMDKTAFPPIVAPPANWTTSRQTQTLQQQLQQYQRYKILRAAYAAQQQKGAAAPAPAAAANPSAPAPKPQQPQGR